MVAPPDNLEQRKLHSERLEHPNSLERLVPDELAEGDITGNETYKLHVERYEFAARHLQGRRLLDVGCGVGYGTRLLAEHNNTSVEVLGLDISPETISYARQRYGGPHIEFRAGDAMTFEDSEGFDGIVALEIIEHLKKPEEFIKHLVSLLRPKGLLVVSTPTTPSTDFNPYHRQDFTPKSFRKLFADHGLKEIHCLNQVQHVSLGAVLRRKEARMQDLRRGMVRFYLHHPRAFLRRVTATMRYGLTNHYTTIVWQRVR